ncbi:MAG: hypothetical protein ACKVHE_21920, partial [Planctomycetales bacterium]
MTFSRSSNRVLNWYGTLTLRQYFPRLRKCEVHLSATSVAESDESSVFEKPQQRIAAGLLKLRKIAFLTVD